MEEQVRAIIEGRSLGESELLPSVRQWLDWKITNVLPRAGGTLDQDPEFMRDFRIICSTESQLQHQQSQVREAQAEIKRRVGR